MKKIFFTTFASVSIGALSVGQNIGINLTGATPNPSSMLDIVAPTKGLLIPRVSLSATTSTSPVLPAPGATEDGLMVYNTATTGDVTPGYYYWDGIALNWVRMLNGGSSSTAWQVTGNFGTTPGTNFLGTTDVQDLAVFTSNTERMRVMSGGNVGIGTSAPLAPLSVASATGSGTEGVLLRLNSINGTGGNGGSILFTNNSDILNMAKISGIDAGSWGGHLTFSTSPNTGSSPGGTPTERMRIDQAGNIGIGSLAPTAKLQIVNSDNTLNNILQVYPQNLTQGVGVGYNYIREIGSNVNNDMFIDAKGTGNMFLSNAANNTGNVYINFVAGIIPGAKLQVGGRVSSYQAGGEASFHLYNGGAIEEWAIRQYVSGGNNTDNSLHIQTLNSGTYTDAIVVSAYSVVSPTLRFVGINCSDPKYQLHVNGNCGVNGTIFANVASVSAGVVACSDIRYKKNIATLPNALDNIMKLRGVSYNWKKEEFPDKNFNDDKQVGVIAQELEKIYPELVMTDKDGYKSVDYSRLTPILIEAIKEQQKTINDQQKTVDNQQLAISKVENENKNLKSNCINSESRILKLEAAVEKLAQPKYKEEAKK